MGQGICLLQPQRSQYGVLPEFAKGLSAALHRQGFAVFSIDASQEASIDDFMLTLDALDPAVVLCVNSWPDASIWNAGLLDKDCSFLGLFVDAPHEYMPFLAHPKISVGICDRWSADFFRSTLDCENSFFFPHAVDAALCEQDLLEPEFDLFFPATCIDYEEMIDSVKAASPTPLFEALMDTVQKARTERTTPLFEHLKSALTASSNTQFIDPANSAACAQLWRLVELIVRGMDRVDLVRSITKHRIDVCGNVVGSRGWAHYLKDCGPNVTYSAGRPFDQVLQQQRRSKILVNSCPQFIDGGHERVFTALASGAIPLTDGGSYLRADFEDNGAAIFFDSIPEASLEDRIAACLADESLRQEQLHAGRQLVAQRHTWDARAELLKNYLQ